MVNVDTKRLLASLIVCFKPHVFLTISIILVIIRSLFAALERGTNDYSKTRQASDITILMVSVIALIAFGWATFFAMMVRYELQSELNSTLVLFQCSKRGLRFLGVIFFHILLLLSVLWLTSSAVERSVPKEFARPHQSIFLNSNKYHTQRTSSIVIGKAQINHRVMHLRSQQDDSFIGPLNQPNNMNKQHQKQQQQNDQLTASTISHYLRNDPPDRYKQISYDENKEAHSNTHIPIRTRKGASQMSYTNSDRFHIVAIYTIWLTAIVYSLTYLILENIVMCYNDVTLIEYVHSVFLHGVAKLTGIDLSDFPAGEMLFNPLMRRRVRIW